MERKANEVLWAGDGETSQILSALRTGSPSNIEDIIRLLIGKNGLNLSGKGITAKECRVLTSVLQTNPCLIELVCDFKLAVILKSSLPAKLLNANNKEVLAYLRSLRPAMNTAPTVINRATPRVGHPQAMQQASETKVKAEKEEQEKAALAKALKDESKHEAIEQQPPGAASSSSRLLSNYTVHNSQTIAYNLPQAGAAPQAAPEDEEEALLREMVRPERIRDEKNIDALIDLYKLPKLRNADVVLLRPSGQGCNDGEILQLFIDARKKAVKAYASGLNSEAVLFHRRMSALLKSEEKKKLSAREAGALAQLQLAAVPEAWVLLEPRGPHSSSSSTSRPQKALVFDWIPNAPRALSAADRDSLRAQIDLCHKLGFCHLDVTARNILPAEDGPAVLMDYDCVCRVGRSALGPLPPESSPRVIRRDSVRFEDDEYLWEQLLRMPLFDDSTAPSAAPSSFA